MTKLAPPEQWVLSKMTEMETAEMIEKYVDFYVEGEDGTRRSVHLPSPFVRHFMRRDDSKMPTIVAVATAPIVLADGHLLAPEGFDRLRGIQFIIPDDLRAIIPAPEDCTPEAVQAAMAFLCDEWLCDVLTDYTGKAILVAAALTLIERSLLPDRPVFFITAGRHGGGKTTVVNMLGAAVTGNRGSVAAWSSNEEERRKALLAYFILGKPYILWDNIPRGLQIVCPHLERSCTAAYYADRKLGVSEMISTAASTIHFFTGNNIGPKGDLASRSLSVRLDVDRVDPENRAFKHPDPYTWTQNNRAEIITALYTILLGNPQLTVPYDAESKTRFKMWWRLIGSAVEHAAAQTIDFQNLFLSQENDEEEAASVADMLEVFEKLWPDEQEFSASAVAALVNRAAMAGSVFYRETPDEDEQLVREVLLPGTPQNYVFQTKSVGRLLKKHLNEPVRSGERALVLVSREDKHAGQLAYRVRTIPTPP
jgi:hypothetical protein